MTDALSVTQIQPTPGYVLVEPAKKQSQTASGIYLPETSEKPQHGTVIACGADTDEHKCPVKKGATVIYKKWGGSDFKINDVEYQFLKFEDVLAQVK